jgi:hypothetical protein
MCFIRFFRVEKISYHMTRSVGFNFRRMASHHSQHYYHHHHHHHHHHHMIMIMTLHLSRNPYMKGNLICVLFWWFGDQFAWVGTSLAEYWGRDNMRNGQTFFLGEILLVFLYFGTHGRFSTSSTSNCGFLDYS